MNIHKVVSQHIVYSYQNQTSGIQESSFLNSISRFNFEGLSLEISHIFQMQKIILLPRILPKIVPEDQENPFLQTFLVRHFCMKYLFHQD